MLRVLAVLFMSVLPEVVAAAAPTPYPERPVRFVVPYAPGGSVDTVARTLGQKLSDAWGQSVIVDNRPGGGANIGTEIVQRAIPDGYTLLLGTTANTVNVHLMKNLMHNFIRDFAPISLLDTFYNVLAINASSPAKSLRELIDLVKSRPGKLTYASSGIGSSNHFSGELFKLMANIEIVHVPYKAAPVALTDLLAGRVDIYFPGIVSSLPLIRSGKLRALGVTGPRRSATVPDIPTIAEAGLPGYELTPWHGLLAPTGTPPDLIAKINRDVVATLALSEVRGKLVATGIDNVIGSSPAELAEFIKRETEKYGKLAQVAGLTKK